MRHVICLNVIYDGNVIYGNLSSNYYDALKGCKIFIQGIQTMRPFPKDSISQCNQLFFMIHSDRFAPVRILSERGSRYSVTFSDDKSPYI